MSETFLSRWSRLKTDQKVESPLPSPPPAEPGEGVIVSPPPGDPGEGQGGGIQELPPIESLTKDSDFSAFLQAGVPDELRKAALSRLWGSDPLFSQPEVYDLHMGDYSQPAVTEVVKTVWKFGKGMAEQLDEVLPEHESANFTDSPEETHNIADKDKPPTANS